MEEVLTYLAIILAVVLLIVTSVWWMFPNLFEAFHHVFFTVSSIITTTGYATVDFNQWTSFAKTLVVLIMFIGACAGSTGGGIKVSRINVMFKGIKKELQMLLHPGLVRKVKMDGKPIPHETVRSINVFIAIYLVTFVVCLVLVTLDGKDLVTSFTAVAATLNNIGPGLGEVGPMGNFGAFSDFSKYVLSFAMLAGRLELIPLLLLLIPQMWEGTIKLTRRIRTQSSRAKNQGFQREPSSPEKRLRPKPEPRRKPKDPDFEPSPALARKQRPKRLRLLTQTSLE